MPGKSTYHTPLPQLVHGLVMRRPPPGTTMAPSAAFQVMGNAEVPESSGDLVWLGEA